MCETEAQKQAEIRKEITGPHFLFLCKADATIMLDEKSDLIDKPQSGLQSVAVRGRRRGRAQDKNE
jgi:hypothetical protein